MIKKVLIILIIFMLCGCVEFKETETNDKCKFVAIDLEGNEKEFQDCYIGSTGLYCTTDNGRILVTEYDYFCEDVDIIINVKEE